MTGRRARLRPAEECDGQGRNFVTRGDILREARRWLGTPYMHQASVIGAGCDCLGLLRGVWRSLYGAEPELAPPYSPDWDEVERREVLFAAARKHLCERDGLAEPGDVILFRMRRDAVAKHIGIVSGRTRFIHAYTGHGVVESALSNPWRRRIAGVFSFPDVSGGETGADARKFGAKPGPDVETQSSN